MSDPDLQERYGQRLAEVNSLYAEMKGAMDLGDSVALNRLAREALARTYDARLILKHVDDPGFREGKDEQLARFIEGLERVINSTAAPAADEPPVPVD